MALWDNLLSYWPCPNVYNYVDTQYVATFTAGVSIGSSGKFDKSWDYAAASDYVNLATPIPTTVAGWTVGAWAYNIRADGDWRTLFWNGSTGTNGSMHIILNDLTPDSEIGVYSNSTFFSTGVSINAASYTGWHHYAAAFNGTVVKFYIDGVLIGSCTPTWPGDHEVQYIGGDTWGEGFAEKIADPAVWARELSADEMATIYNSGEALSELIPRRQFPDNGQRSSWIDMADNTMLYHMYDTTGVDTSVNSNTAVVSSATIITGKTLYSGSSEFTGAIHFDGTNTKVDTLVSAGDIGIDGSLARTIMVWAKSDSWTANKIIWSMGNNSNGQDFSLVAQGGDTLTANLWGGGNDLTGISVPDTSIWNHVAVVYSGPGTNTLSVYVNAVLAGSNNPSSVNTSISNNIIVGDTAHNGGWSNWNGDIQEFAIFDVELTSTDILNTYNAQKFLFLGTGSQTAINLFGSVVHDSFPSTATALNLFGSVVHDSQPPTATAINLFSSVVHNPVPISGTVPNITGTMGVSASFDATALGVSTGSANYQWSWETVPSGSSLSNATFPLPDNQATTLINMSGNLGLWHFESSASITPFPDSQAATPIDMTDNKGLYHFEGDADDSSGNGINGTPFGATQVAGKVGSFAYNFDGNNDYIAYGTNFQFTTEDFTVACWVRPVESQNSWAKIWGTQGAGAGDGYIVERYSGTANHYRFQSGNGSSWYADNSTFYLQPDAWSHLVIVRVGAVVTGYVNGTLAYTDVAPTTIADNDDFYMGRDQGGTYWEGDLDEFAIWDRELSAAEIEDIFTKQFGGFEDGSGEGNGLVKVGNPTLTTGKVGTYAADFNGTTDGLIKTLNNPPTADGTIAGWVYLNETDNDKIIFGLGPPEIGNGTWRAFQVNDSGLLRFVGYANDLTTTTTLNTGQWYHLGMTWDSADDVVVYVDGVSVAANSIPGLVTPKTDFNIAFRDDTWGTWWTDMVADEMAIWNRALSPLEINQLVFLNSGSCASGSVGLGETFTFTPDVTGTYNVELSVTDGAGAAQSGSVQASIAATPSSGGWENNKAIIFGLGVDSGSPLNGLSITNPTWDNAGLGDDYSISAWVNVSSSAALGGSGDPQTIIALGCPNPALSKGGSDDGGADASGRGPFSKDL